MSQQSGLPQLAVDHFRRLGFSSVGTDSGGSLFITSVSSKTKGWRGSPFKSTRISVAELKRLADDGATHATLSYSGRRAEFSIADLLASIKVKQPA